MKILSKSYAKSTGAAVVKAMMSVQYAGKKEREDGADLIEAQAKRIASLEAKITKLKAESNFWWDENIKKQTACEQMGKRITELENARAVKPLEWEETMSDRGDGTSEHDGGYEAFTPFGIYTISLDYLKGLWVVYGLDGDCLDSVDSPSIAKSTAEADYSARHRAALIEQPIMSSMSTKPMENMK